MVNRTLLADSRASWFIAHQFNDPASVTRRDDACHEFIAISIVRLTDTDAEACASDWIFAVGPR